MKKMNFSDWVRLLATPVLLIGLGAVLLFSPDSAAALIVRILGWILIAGCAATVMFALMSPGALVTKVLTAVILGLGGIWMVTHPLGLAAWLGRLVGIVLVFQGIQDLIYNRIRMGSPLMPILLVVVGAVLVFLPMTTSRLVFAAIGAVILALGVFNLITRVKRARGFNEPEDPNIIDAL